MDQYGELPREIPLDVLEYIIELASEDRRHNERKKTLLSCTLVCRAWVTKSRIYLYRRIVLFRQQKATKFIDTVTSSPLLGEYVQSLLFAPSYEDMNWVSTVHRVLPTFLPNVHFLIYDRLPPYQSPFVALASGFKNVTCLVLRYPNSRWTFQQVARLLNGFPKLKMLQTIGVDMETDPFDDPKPSPQDTGATSFHLRCISGYTTFSIAEDALLWLSKRQSSHTLNELWVDCDKISAQSQNFVRVLRQCSGTLESLRISFYEIGSWDTGENEDPSNLMLETTWIPVIASCSNLGRFEMLSPRSSKESILFLELLFSHLPSSLHSIGLHFDAEEVFSEDSRGFWETIDTTLTSNKFPKLNYFELIGGAYLIRLHNQGVFKEFLPNLYKQGILWCTSLSRDFRYPIKPSTHTLPPDDFEAWGRLACITPFPGWEDCHPEDEDPYLS